MGETLGFVTLSNGYEELNTLPSPPAWSEESEQKSCNDWPCCSGFSGVLCWMLARGGRVRFGSESPSLQIDGQPEGSGLANAKMPRLLAFARHVEMVIIEALKPRSTTLMGSRTLFVVTDTLGYLEMEPALQCRRQDCVPDSSSLKPCLGATEGVLD